MKILYMGTPDYAAVILKDLLEAGHEICGVISQPDKPKGRGYQLTPPPVKVLALENGLPVYQPTTLRDEAFAELLKTLDPEMIVVAAYGKILPKNVLDYPKYGCINAHASLLPKYRGAAPIQRAIMDGEQVTGVTAMYMEEGLDTGDMICRELVPIEKEDNFETLHDKLAVAGGKAILTAISAIAEGKAAPEKQDEAAFTYASKITKEDGILDFSRPAKALYDQVRGLSPFPLSYTHLPDGKLLKVIEADYSEGRTSETKGQVLSLENGQIAVAVGDGCLLLKTVLPEGKGRMSAADFIRGRRIQEGAILK